MSRLTVESYFAEIKEATPTELLDIITEDMRSQITGVLGSVQLLRSYLKSVEGPNEIDQLLRSLESSGRNIAIMLEAILLYRRDDHA